MKISKGLVIDDPWIGLILDGAKSWEMRSTSTSHRGWFGLIRKGSGAVHGVARLCAVGAPLSPAEMIDTIAHHRIPEDMIRSGRVDRWNTPWKLADVRRLTAPVPYRHRSGAVTWVNLDADTSSAIAARLGAEIPPAPAGTTRPGPSFPGASPDNTAAGTAAPPPPQGGTRIGEVELTQGNLNNSHFYLRPFFDRFPDDAIGGSNKALKAGRDVTIDWGGPAPVRTDLDQSKRFFRARGWVRQFFADNDAEPGDRVLIEETAPYRYRVHLRKA